ncbi:hypothetical protein Tco_0074961, partial [Tanacetum coccineum]
MLKTMAVDFEIRTIGMRQFGCAIRKNFSNSERTGPSGIRGPSYEAPLRVVIALASFLGFGMVLLGNELELEA